MILREKHKEQHSQNDPACYRDHGAPFTWTRPSSINRRMLHFQQEESAPIRSGGRMEICSSGMSLSGDELPGSRRNRRAVRALVSRTHNKRLK